MGKKKADVMAEQKKMFVERAVQRGFNQKKADDLFELMAYFAGYGFNKSHSAAYALIAYQTAYLKANFPAEFTACLISLESSNAENMVFYLKEAKDMGLEILPPNINTSEIEFSIVDEKILFGLQGIKNIGTTSLTNIIAQRKKDGPFKDLLNLCKRIDLRTSNKRVLENLISAGALDSLPGNRAQKHHELANIIELALQHKEHEATGQMQLFGATVNLQDPSSQLYTFPTIPELSTKEILEKEKEVLGFYISSHPLESYPQLSWIKTQNIAQIAQLLAQPNAGGTEPIVTTAGLLIEKKVISTKKGDKMAFVKLEDKTGNAEIIVFPKLFAKVDGWLQDYSIFVVKGNLDLAGLGTCKIKAMEIVPLELIFHSWPKFQHIQMQLPSPCTQEHIEIIKKLDDGKIPVHILYQEHETNLKIISKKNISLSMEVITKLQQNDITGTITL